MSTSSATSSLPSSSIPARPHPVEAEIENDTVVIRTQEPTQSPHTATTHWQAGARIQGQLRTRGTHVLPWQVAFLDSESKLRHELQSYVHLPDNWDGEGAVRPTQTAIDDALRFLDGRPPDITLPYPEHGFHGEVGVYWDNRDTYVFAEVTFEGDGTFSYYGAYGVPSATVDECGRDDADVSAPWPNDMLRILRKPDHIRLAP